MCSESPAPCGGAGKASSANSLSRCLKGQGFPELRASTWVPSAKAGTGRPVKLEPALEEAAHLWLGPSARYPCPEGPMLLRVHRPPLRCAPPHPPSPRRRHTLPTAQGRARTSNASDVCLSPLASGLPDDSDPHLPFPPLPCSLSCLRICPLAAG